MNINKISIIVPVYKVEKYLSSCLYSLINQTYRNLEIILVDDGSPDNCPKICDEFALKDDRIKVIHKENEGVSVARNVALDICTGDFIGFVDSDDKCELNMFEELLNACTTNNVELSMCGCHTIKNGVSHDAFYYENNIIVPIEKARYNILTDIWGGQLWNKLFKRTLWEGVRFPIGRVFQQDMAVIHLCFFKTQKDVAFIHKPLYFYQLRGDSSSYRKKPINGICSFLGFSEKLDFCEKNFPSAKDICLAKASSYALGVINLKVRKKITKDNEYYIKAQEFLRKYKTEIKQNNYLEKNRKRLLRIYYFSPALYLLLAKLSKK